MRLLGKERLQWLLQNDESVNEWIRSWVYELTYANWKTPMDVSHQFPNVRQSNSGHFVFPVSKCNKKIYLLIAFQQGVAIITDLR